MSLSGNDSYTKLLIHSDAADGNATFPDRSGSGHTITVNGNTHHEVDQKKFNRTSIHFDGTGDYLSVPDSADWDFGSGDFTIDFWLRRTRSGAVERFFGQSDSGGSSRSLDALFQADDTFRTIFAKSGGGTVTATTTATITDTNWHHVAIVRNGNTLTQYIDGTADGTGDVTGETIANSSTIFTVGGLGLFTSQHFLGYIDEFRVSKGIARWTADFTPPTAPYSLPFDEDNKLKLTIAAADVGSALTDFPVLINLGTSSGKSSFDASAVFDELTPADVDDNFTGTDGDAPDTRLWEVKAGTPTIQGNALRVRRDNSIDDAVKTIFKISGNLDVQVDFSSFTSAGNAGAFGIEINEDTDDRGYVFIYSDGTSSYYSSAVYVAGTPTNGTPAATTDTSGKLRIVRSGSTINLYYWNGSSWTLQQTATVTTSDVNIHIWTSTWATNPACSALVDNFTVNSGTVVWEDTPKQLAFEIGDTGVQCYCEIERWDGANETAQLWIKIPSISASAATVLNLYYDSAQPDNNTYIGDTGDTPAQNVWDSNFAAVLHMAQDPSGTAPQMLDSTGSYDLTSSGTMTSGDLVNGLIGKGVDLDGSDDHLDSSSDDFSALEAAMTMEASVKWGTVGAYKMIGTIGNASSGTLQFGLNSAGSFYGISVGGDFVNSAIVPSTTAFQNMATVLSGGAMSLYGDGVVDPATNPVTVADLSSVPIRVGGRFDGCYGNLIVDEFRVSKVARSAAWLAVTHKSNTDALITFALPSSGVADRHIPSFANIPRSYNMNFMPGFTPAGLIRQNRKGFSKAF